MKFAEHNRAGVIRRLLPSGWSFSPRSAAFWSRAPGADIISRRPPRFRLHHSTSRRKDRRKHLHRLPARGLGTCATLTTFFLDPCTIESLVACLCPARRRFRRAAMLERAAVGRGPAHADSLARLWTAWFPHSPCRLRLQATEPVRRTIRVVFRATAGSLHQPDALR